MFIVTLEYSHVVPLVSVFDNEKIANEYYITEVNLARNNHSSAHRISMQSIKHNISHEMREWKCVENG